MSVMFDNLRRAFKEAVENFHQEMGRDSSLGRERVAETVDSLLRGMEREAVDAKTALDAVEKDLAQAREKAAAEGREAETCRRREQMARKIGDEETADVAARFGEKHEQRQRVFLEKAEALEAEARLAESEYRGMLRQIKEARSKRSAMEAGAGRARAREALNDPDDLFGEFDRMAEKTAGSAAEAAGGAAEGAAPAGYRGETADFDDELLASRRAQAVDAQLDELKRRMGRK